MSMKKKKRRSMKRLAWTCCGAAVVLIMAASLAMGHRLGKAIRDRKPEWMQIQNVICGYIGENAGRILSEMEMMQSWAQSYATVYESDGRIMCVNRERYEAEEVSDEAVIAFVQGHNITDLIYPAGGDTDIEINFEKTAQCQLRLSASVMR